jgi:F-type H+-transporting ATPase subunit gamma
VARAALASARDYREALESAVRRMPPIEEPAPAGPPLLLVVGADLGLCGGYHARVAEAARADVREIGAGAIDCVGHRTAALLVRAGCSPRKVYGAPSSVESATRVLLDVVDDVFAAHRESGASVYSVSARFAGVGVFQTARTRLLPLEPLTGAGPPASPYVTLTHLRETAARERLFVSLQELMLDAMASEHGARLVATNAAGQWLDREVERARRQLRTMRRESATQELLELAAGARRKRATIHPR